MILKTDELLVTAKMEDGASEIPLLFCCDEELLVFIKTFIHNAKDGSYLKIERG